MNQISGKRKLFKFISASRSTGTSCHGIIDAFLPPLTPQASVGARITRKGIA